MSITEIFEDKDKHISLRQVLSALAPHLPTHGWHILELEVVADGTIDLGEFQNRATADRAGLKLAEIMELAATVTDTVWLTIIQQEEGKQVPQLPVTEQFYRDCSIVIECEDGHIWRLSTDKEQLHKTLIKRFPSNRIERLP